MLKELLIVLAVTTVLAVAVAEDDFDPFIDIPFKRLKTSAERIESDGYPAESHYVETSDGYVLNLFRIPHSPKLNNGQLQRPVVLIMHGLFSCSDCFLLNGPNDALPYNYADAGYDVWLGNARGNIYSRNNTRLNVKHPYFWKFSWHEIGSIDLPAMIDYILEQTHEQALHYVGHSQGCTAFVVMGSFRPEYNAKIKTAHLLAPPVFMGNTTEGLIVATAPVFGEPGLGTALLENQVLLPYNQFIQRLLDTTCSNQPLMLSYCKTLAMLWGGPEIGNLNQTLLPQIAETHPAGVSSNQAIHFIQSYVSNDFRLYDWGKRKNLAYYGVEQPPAYDLSQITSELYLYYGLSDGSANKKDISRLPELLPNLALLHEVPDPTWGHLDFVFAQQVKSVINDLVVDYSMDYDVEQARRK
ncbi:lipase 3 [Drosophila subobscura]|uniref:lipase 3 n=1 Tax=Drosophila subobscura TaxID=7241 RepID=UPI00155AE3AE|nr:lipase 3 [Drosophila subobscura]